MTRLFLRLVIVTSLVAVLAPAAALAQSPPTPTQVARQYVAAGQAAQESGDYDTAITFYQKAYQLTKHPVMIFNIAQANRLAGRLDQALSLYQRYLNEDPHGSQVQTARELIAEIERRKTEEVRKAEEARKAAEDARKAEVARKAEDAQRAEAERKAAEARKLEEARKADDAHKAEDARVAEASPSTAPGATPLQDTGASAAPAPGRNLRIAGLAVGGGGAVALAIGTGYALHAHSLANELSQFHAPYTRAKEASLNRANTIAVVGLVGGTVLVAAGAATYWWGYKQGQSERLSVAPLVSKDVAGVALSGLW
jgi:tetratricopeptide (TPR) repeat protein